VRLLQKSPMYVMSLTVGIAQVRRSPSWMSAWSTLTVPKYYAAYKPGPGALPHRDRRHVIQDDVDLLFPFS